MALDDLVFKTGSATIYDPLTATTASTVTVTVENMGTDDLSSLGLYVSTTTTLGDVDNPAQFPPETDYQDLLSWGTASDAGVTPTGGIYLTIPQNGPATFNGYVTRTQGADVATKIDFIDLAAGATADFTIELQTPPSVTSRRLFVNFALE